MGKVEQLDKAKETKIDDILFVKSKDIITLFFWSSIMGLIWEIVTADLWIYDPNQFTLVYFLNQEIPIAYALIWGIILTSSFILIELVQNKLFKRKGKIRFLMCTILIMALIGYIIEYVGVYFGMWSYTFAENYQIWISIVPLRVWIGWAFFGTLMLSTIRFVSINKNTRT